MSHAALSRGAATLLTAGALVAATLIAPTAQAAAGDRPGAAPASAREIIAGRTLARAQSALSGQGGDATMALRDLWQVRDDLSPADRATADKLGGRPSKSDTLDAGNIRVHYTPTEMTGPFDATDVLNTAVSVSQAYSGAGYRQPKPDKRHGGSSATDIYVDSLPAGLYGYCTTDQPRFSAPGHHDVWAFCVVDNDYFGFPSHTPLENLQVTVAHEYYHATQFAYDLNEDGWLLEATATWAEDELYTGVNDNLQYLADSPITDRQRSMDLYGGVYHYGVWIFFRYLSETFPKEKGGLPRVLLDIWKAADSSKGAARDKYSTQAINSVLSKRKYTLPLDKAFSLFSDANRRTRSVYSEGQANAYPVKKLSGRKTLGGKGSTKTFTVKLDHLASSTYRFTPKNGSHKLRVTISGPAKVQGTRAVVSVWKQNGTVKQKYVAISARGRGAITARFASSSVKAVEVTLVNASTRFTQCQTTYTPYACSGNPADQGRRLSVRGKVV